MKHITILKNILLIFLCICLIGNSWAQTAEEDTVISKQEKIWNIAYSAQPSWMVTDAVAIIEGEQLGKTLSSSFGNTLIGRLPGLTVVPLGSEPGEDAPMLVARGVGTFSGGRDILVIVDGFESAYNQLVPEEVESVTLLKDAASAAMYGSKGANGVLLITTKRGKEGPLQINFSAQVGLESALHLPDFLGSYDYAALYNEALNNDGIPDLYTASDLSAYQSGSSPYFHPDVDWYDQVLRNFAPVSEYNLSFRGGARRARYFVSLNGLSRSGLYKKTEEETDFSSNSTFTQYNIRTNVDLDLTESLTASILMGIAIADKANPAANTTASLFDLISSVPPNAFPVFNPNGTYGGNALYTNPWGDILETGWYTQNSRNVQSALRLTQSLDMFLPGLSASVAASFNNSFMSNSNRTRNYERYSISDDGTGQPVYVPFGTETSLSASEGGIRQWSNATFQSFLNYDLTSGSNQFHAILGFNSDQVILQGEGIPYKNIDLMGRFTYAHNTKYIGELSFAYSGANGYAEGQRFGLFPAVSLGWIVSNEEFLQGSSIVNYLKIRGSYGISGNNYLGSQRFLYEQYYDREGTHYFGTANSSMAGYAEAQIANPDLTWEKEKEMNIGFEAVLAEKLNIGLDLFQQNRIDILAEPNKTVPQFLGGILPSLNVGEVKNTGLEARVGYTGDQSGDFQYFADLSVWYARNEIVFMSETPQEYDYMYRTGRPVDQPFLLEDLGFFPDQGDINGSPQQVFAEVQPGDLKYKDQDGDGIVDQSDRYPAGYTDIPELTFSLNAGLTYKIIYLDLLFQGVTNRSVYLTGKDFYAFQDDGKITSWAMDRWTSATANAAEYPRLSTLDNQNNFQPSTFWQRDGNFIKLRYAELGVKLPVRIVERINLSGTKIFISGTNLFSMDKLDVADPEILSGYPAVRSFSIGTKIQF